MTDIYDTTYWAHFSLMLGILQFISMFFLYPSESRCSDRFRLLLHSERESSYSPRFEY